MAYSKEEIEQFRKKDKRISMQGLVQVILATGADKEKVQENCELAKKYSDEIERLAEGEVEKKTEEKSTVPAPKLDQKKVLDYIAKELNVELDDSLKNDVLDYIEKEYGKRVYPTKKASVEKFIKERK